MTGRQVLRKSFEGVFIGVSHFIRGVVFTPSSIDVHRWYVIGSYLLPVQGKGGVGGGGFQERSNSLLSVRKNAETQSGAAQTWIITPVTGFISPLIVSFALTDMLVEVFLLLSCVLLEPVSISAHSGLFSWLELPVQACFSCSPKLVAAMQIFQVKVNKRWCTLTPRTSSGCRTH